MSKELQLNIQKGKGRPKKLYIVLDCATATLPFIKSLEISDSEKRKLSIAKPLIYDIAWRVVDRVGTVYSQHSFLVQETFFVPQVFNTAYYKDKRALYMEKFKNSKKYIETQSQSIHTLVNHSQDDMELTSQLEENQSVVRKNKSQNKETKMNNNLL